MPETPRINLEPEDKRVLELIQSDFPLVRRPFRQLGEACGLTEAACLDRIRDLLERNIIREISAIYNAERLGYRSTLVAVSLPANRADEAAEIINRHPGVSHNYLRNHHYNIWFTLTIPEEKDFAGEIRRIDRDGLFDSFLLLPAIRTFKINVRFRFPDREQAAVQGPPDAKTVKAAETPGLGRPDRVILSAERILLVKALQLPFPAVPEPWKIIAENCGITEDRLFGEINYLKKTRALKRIAGVLRHRRAGFSANGMACFAVAEERIETAGNLAAGFDEVSHCYQRPAYPDWPYTLFAMVHSRIGDECVKVIDKIAETIQCPVRETLFSEKEYKKERVRYFWEET